MAVQEAPERIVTEPEHEDSSANVGVILKAFTMLEAMAEIGEPVALRDIATTTGLPKATLHRFLRTLCGIGYINQDSSTGEYSLSSKMAHIGRNVQHEDLKASVLPMMKALHREFNETVNLGILEGQSVYYVIVLEARRALSWRVPAGTRDEYYSTALGRAIVSQLSEDKMDALLKRTKTKPRTAFTRLDLAELRAELAKVRESGIAFDLQENDDGVVCLGVPVFFGGHVAGAVSVSIPERRYTEALGAEISERLLSFDRQFGVSR